MIYAVSMFTVIYMWPKSLTFLKFKQYSDQYSWWIYREVQFRSSFKILMNFLKSLIKNIFIRKANHPSSYKSYQET